MDPAVGGATAPQAAALLDGAPEAAPAAAPAAAGGVAPRPKLEGYEFYRTVLGNPRTVVAPMVDQSELAWRELSRRYGADLCYTPMINSSVFLRNPKGKRGHVFTTAPDDRPLIAQFCGNEPETVLAAAKSIEDQVDAVDLNFGCPQNIARKGRYGAFLMDDWDLVSSLVKKLHEGLTVPVTCKIRVFDDVAKSVEYAKMIEASGCQMLTVHGRTIKQKGQLTGMADWEAIKAIKAAVSIPVVANGNILYEADVDECIRKTGVDGVMSAEANLTDPTVFDKGEFRVWDVTEQYLEIVKKHGTPWPFAKSHLFKLWHACLKRHIDIRNNLGRCNSLAEGEAVAAELKARLIAAEERGDEADQEPVIHHTQSGPRKVAPYWVCQPRVRDLEKDKRVVQEVKAQGAAAKAASKAAKAAAKAAIAEADQKGRPADALPAERPEKRARVEATPAEA